MPQERQIFTTLSVEENLRVADLRRHWTLEAVYALFPRLAERRRNGGGQLSGGEQQMLAIGRARMGSPTCLLESGMSLIVVEQHARLALELAEQAVGLERGRVRLAGSRAELLERWDEVEGMLALTH